MRASLATSLLVIGFLSNLSGVVQGLPIAQTAEVASRGITHDGDLIFERSEEDHGLEVVPRDDNDFVHHHFKGLLARVIPPRPPPLPKLPIPRPIEGGAGTGAGAGAGAGASRTGGVPINRPPAREPTPPRPDPPEGQPGVNRNGAENPGAGEGKGNPPQDMETYRTAGATQMTNYEAILRSDKKDTPIVKTEAELAGVAKNDAFLDIRLNDQYKVPDPTGVTASDVKELKLFNSAELGFDPKQPPQLMAEIRVNNPQGELINRGTYDKEGRFIVYQDAFKEADTATGVKKTPLNEIGMQLFLTTAGDKAKNFRAVFLSNVQNQEFWAIVKQNYIDLGQEFKQVLTFERGTPQFERIMGSPNVNSKFFSFANHRGAIGNKVPDKVIVVPKQVEENSSGGLAVAIVFKDLDA